MTQILYHGLVDRFTWLAIVLATACNHTASVTCTSCDASVDSNQSCFAGQPNGLLGGACIYDHTARTLTDLVIDTTAGSPLCEGDIDFIASDCVVTGTSITIPAGVRVSAIGTRPLVVVALDSIDLEGTLDVSSHRSPAEVIGPAHDDSRCIATSGSDDAIGGTGGAGGSFQFLGGAGGATGTTPPAQPGQAPTLVSLHGGCPGAKGGSYLETAAGALGHSGGALYLMAGASIVLGPGAALLSNGEGGGKAGIDGGGGGGGTGGMIVLDAPSIALATSATVFAEGGGGGGGGDQLGDSGDGSEVDTTPGATGGSAAAPAGPGGSGSVSGIGGDGQHGPISPTTATGGGGGGGGASGYVLVFGSLTSTAVISPPPS